jgi:hypothetical protein
MFVAVAMVKLLVASHIRVFLGLGKLNTSNVKLFDTT